MVELYHKILKDEQLRAIPSWEVIPRPNNPSQDRKDLHNVAGAYFYLWELTGEMQQVHDDCSTGLLHKLQRRMSFVVVRSYRLNKREKVSRCFMLNQRKHAKKLDLREKRLREKWGWFTDEYNITLGRVTQREEQLKGKM